jgi:hypothetical protein
MSVAAEQYLSNSRATEKKPQKDGRRLPSDKKDKPLECSSIRKRL